MWEKFGGKGGCKWLGARVRERVVGNKRSDGRAVKGESRSIDEESDARSRAR